MSFFRMRSGQVRLLLAEAGVALAAAVLIAGCGTNYRPVVTPVSSSGPAAQVTSYAVAISANSTADQGIVSIVDYSGDSLMVQQPVGLGPLAFTIDEIGGTGYTFNSDHTITNFPISTTLQPKQETITTLPANSQPINLLAPSSGMWIGDLTDNVVDIFSNSPQTFKLSIPMAPASTPVFIAGSATGTGQRQYVINQNTTDPVQCNLAPASGPLGSAVPIEVSSFTTDVPIPVGVCPVFAVQSPDLRRLFVLNRGDDTITVINSQTNALDQCAPFLNQNGQPVTCHPTLPLSTTAVTATGITPPNGTAGMPTVAGPVYAEYNIATSQLVVADYDGGTISVIDVSMDQYGNDSPTFGTTYTIKVGNTATPYPASVTVLADGTKAYTANQGDCTPDCTTSPNGTVTVVNLSSHTVEKTITVAGLPRTVVSTQNSGYAKVYAASPNNPNLNIISSTPTTSDVVASTVLTEANVLDVRVTTQAGAAQSVTTYNGSQSISNPNFSSRIPGYGQPCYLPPNVLGTGYQLAQCQQIP